MIKSNWFANAFSKDPWLDLHEDEHAFMYLIKKKKGIENGEDEWCDNYGKLHETFEVVFYDRTF